MKKNVLLNLICVILMIYTCAYAEDISIYCEYDDGSRIVIEDGCTIESDGELMIALTGLDAGQIYRIQFKGNALDGTPFVDHRGTAGLPEDIHYYTLTDKAGAYGPFELMISNGGNQRKLAFSLNVQPDKSKDWLEYGILNEAGYAEMPPFLAVVPGDMTDEMQADDFGITDPLHGSVYSGDENCQFWVTIEVKVPNKELDWRILDLETNTAIVERHERLPFVSNFSMPVESEMLKYGHEYAMEIVSGKQRAYSTFSIVEEKDGMTADVEETLAAREMLKEKYMEEHAMNESQINDEHRSTGSDAILENSDQFRFVPIQKDERVIVNKPLYDRLVEAFNAAYTTYDDGMLSEFGLYAYNRKKDEGALLQSFAKSMAREAASEMQMKMESAEIHMKNNLLEGQSVTDTFAALGIKSLIVPIHVERMQKVSAKGNGDVAFGPVGYVQIQKADGECAADVMICAEWVNDKIYGKNRYIFARFVDPRGDGSQIYEWCVADQVLAKELMSLLDPIQIEWAEGADATALEISETSEEENYLCVRIRESGNVNVRQKNNSESPKIGSAKAGKEYPCLSVEDNGWFQIQLENGDVGFISGKMAELVE